MALSERFSNETEDVIQERMLATMDPEIDQREGSVTWDLTRPSALEIAQAYQSLDFVITFGVASEDMPSDFLNKRCAELGVHRKPAVKAVGSLTFTGTDGQVVDAGTRVSTDSPEPVYFVTTEAGTIAGGTVTVKAEAETGGANGNVAADSITLVLGDLVGVVFVNNPQPFDGGADVESDDSLLARYFEKVQKPATSGNAYHYLQWAKEVPGVGDARVFPLWNGNGTVKVVLLDSELTAPPQSVVDAAKTYIEANRPIGATVTVVGATETAINVMATLTLNAGATIEQATTEFTASLKDYLKSLAFSDAIVRYTKIASLLAEVSVVADYANLKVNGGTSNITVADDAVAVIGAVTLS